MLQHPGKHLGACGEEVLHTQIEQGKIKKKGGVLIFVKGKKKFCKFIAVDSSQAAG